VRRLADPRVALGVAVVVGLAVRLVRVAEAPLVHPDSPAYLALAQAVRAGEWGRVLGGYYSPLYPVLIAPVAALGVPLELAGRLVATIAGVAALPLVLALARAIAGETPAAAAVLLAALSPALVKASAQVLPETLAGALLLGWGLVLARATRLRAYAAAAALAGTTYLARPEGVLLGILGVGWALWRRRPAAAAASIAVTLVVMAPALLALHERTGRWQLSLREAALVERAGIAHQTSLAGAALHRPGAFAARWAGGAAWQTWNTLVALGPVTAPLAFVGLGTTAPAWPLGVSAAFVAGPLALDPSPRYAVPILPLLLPWAGAGLVAVTRRLRGAAVPAIAAAALVLVVQCVWKGKAFDEACSREVGALVFDRYGPGVRLVAVDGRFAYVARGEAIVPKSTDPHVALALARRRAARLWLTRRQWLGAGFAPPADVHEVARPCHGAFVLYELDESTAGARAAEGQGAPRSAPR